VAVAGIEPSGFAVGVGNGDPSLPAFRAGVATFKVFISTNVAATDLPPMAAVAPV
jgi:hypothetical protein